MGDAAQEQEHGLRVDVVPDGGLLLRRLHERCQRGDERRATFPRLGEDRIGPCRHFLEERVLHQEHEVRSQRTLQAGGLGAVEQRPEFIEPAPDERLFEFFDDGEVAVHGRHADLGGPGHGIQADAAAAVEKRAGSLEDLRPIPVGVSAGGGHGSSIGRRGADTDRVSVSDR